MAEQARVVIIGGGIMGTSLLYHLAHEGWRDCVLIEKGELTSGSTWHAAGQITHSTSSFTLGKFSGYAIDLYRSIEAETGQSVTFHDCGSLRLAYTDDEVDWLRQTVSVGAALEHPMEMLGPGEIAKKHPFYNLDGVKAGLWTPEDGHVDPAGATFAMARGARNLGAKIVRHNRALDTERLPNGEWLVRTEQGDWRAEIIVNAGGTYARQIGRWVGLNLPITCMTHHYFVTEPIAEFTDLAQELPVVRDDRLVSGYIRMEQKSGLIGIYEKANPNTVWLDGTPWESENELFDPDYERIMPWLENALERMPVLAESGIRRTVHGAITHPPDGNMLLGPAPGLDNYWCCCGSQIGVGWGPGAGKYLAQWMVHGAADVSMRELDPRRYGEFADRDYAVRKACEDYLLRHEIPYPGFNRLEARPVKTSAIYERLVEQGAVHEEVFGWERPRWFARGGMAAKDIHSFRRAPWLEMVEREVKAVRDGVGLMDISAFAKIEVKGADAADFLDKMIANRLPRPCRIVLTHLLNELGRIEAETTVIGLEDGGYYLVCAAFFETRIFDWLERYAPKDKDVTIVNRSEALGALALQGPKSRDVLAVITDAALDNASFPWLGARQIDIAGADVRALRMSYAGELGWELHLPMEALATVYDRLMEAGAGYGIENTGSFAMNAMRMEKMFKGASELTNEVTLPEADVMRFARLDKPGGFIGQAATRQAAEADTLRWVCVFLEVDTDVDCHGGEAVMRSGRRIGSVSSGAYGPSVQRSLAFAYVDPESAQAGQELEVMVLGENRPAWVLGKAPYDPDNLRPRTDA
ncbi:MAG: FAD-dependent oxidoreductase [Ectothiorhodospiraceae bacterium AqS1]|nr:FAD-dependent oxidoreductase [Ectothiorhodospiraceae bacterium AqS1]